jgi:hypothetical protein
MAAPAELAVPVPVEPASDYCLGTHSTVIERILPRLAVREQTTLVSSQPIQP